MGRLHFTHKKSKSPVTGSPYSLYTQLGDDKISLPSFVNDVKGKPRTSGKLSVDKKGLI